MSTPSAIYELTQPAPAKPEACGTTTVALMLVVALVVLAAVYAIRGEMFTDAQTKNLCAGPLRPDWCGIRRWADPARGGHNDGNPSGPGIDPVYCGKPTTGLYGPTW